jgi:hypothetical protein
LEVSTATVPARTNELRSPKALRVVVDWFMVGNGYGREYGPDEGGWPSKFFQKRENPIFWLMMGIGGRIPPLLEAFALPTLPYLNAR